MMCILKRQKEFKGAFLNLLLFVKMKYIPQRFFHMTEHFSVQILEHRRHLSQLTFIQISGFTVFTSVPKQWKYFSFMCLEIHQELNSIFYLSASKKNVCSCSYSLLQRVCIQISRIYIKFDALKILRYAGCYFVFILCIIFDIKSAEFHILSIFTKYFENS